MSSVEASVDRMAVETRFSGVVRVDRGDEIELEKAYGLADRRCEIPNGVDTRFAIASGTKGFTALAVMSQVEEGRLGLDTRARSILGDDLPLIDGDVTVGHLLAHRSGIGDYFDEELERPISDYVLAVPGHELDTTESYLKALDGYPTKFRPGEGFSYSSGGYVVLAIIAERVSGTPFHELVEQRVCQPARMLDTEFLRSDELPGRTAVGYLNEESLRTNVLHLPVRGTGDGGLYSTAADISSFWASLFAGKIVSKERVAEMVRPHSDAPEHAARYGLGFWLHASRDVVELHGYDAGVSFTTAHDPDGRITYTVMSNTSEGAWPIIEHLEQALMT
jgi:CubicO group peptidase (beta-lactamase class C family)